VGTQTAYAFVDERRKRTEEVTRGDEKQARIEEEVPEVSMSASNQEKRTIRQVVAFSKQPAKADPIENTTPKTAKARKVPGKKAPALDTGNYEVLGSSQLDYTILARQERETGELTSDSYQRLTRYKFPRTNELLPGPRLHQRKSQSLTFLPSLA